MKASTLKELMRAVEFVYKTLETDMKEAEDNGCNSEYKGDIQKLINGVDDFTTVIQSSLSEFCIEYNK